MLLEERVKTPNLIQRMRLQSPVREAPIRGVDQYLAMDYMGSSEFEWGALPQSLKRVCRSWMSFERTMLKDVKDYKGKRLVLLCPAALAKEYSAFLRKLAKAKDEFGFRFKELPYFLRNLSGKDWDGKPLSNMSRVDAWWDIDNDVFWCFGVEVADIIATAIAGTIAKKKEAGDTEWLPPEGAANG